MEIALENDGGGAAEQHARAGLLQCLIVALKCLSEVLSEVLRH